MIANKIIDGVLDNVDAHSRNQFILDHLDEILDSMAAPSGGAPPAAQPSPSSAPSSPVTTNPPDAPSDDEGPTLYSVRGVAADGSVMESIPLSAEDAARTMAEWKAAHPEINFGTQKQKNNAPK
jgi:hypothetical protein